MHQVPVRFGLALGVLCVAGVAMMLLLGAWAARRDFNRKGAFRRGACIGPRALSQRLEAHDIPASS